MKRLASLLLVLVLAFAAFPLSASAANPQTISKNGYGITFSDVVTVANNKTVQVNSNGGGIDSLVNKTFIVYYLAPGSTVTYSHKVDGTNVVHSDVAWTASFGVNKYQYMGPWAPEYIPMDMENLTGGLSVRYLGSTDNTGVEAYYIVAATYDQLKAEIAEEGKYLEQLKAINSKASDFQPGVYAAFTETLATAQKVTSSSSREVIADTYAALSSTSSRCQFDDGKEYTKAQLQELIKTAEGQKESQFNATAWEFRQMVLGYAKEAIDGGDSYYIPLYYRALKKITEAASSNPASNSADFANQTTVSDTSNTSNSPATPASKSETSVPTVSSTMANAPDVTDEDTVIIAGAARIPGQIQNTNFGDYLYTVSYGDTLYDLSARFYGTGDLWKELQAANQEWINETADGMIFVGFNLLIPAELGDVRANIG